MHIHFVGEPDDGMSLSSHHARLLERAGCRTSFASASEAPILSGSVGTAAAVAPSPAVTVPSSSPTPLIEGSRSTGAFAVHAVFNEAPDAALVRQLLAQREMGIPVLRFWTGADLLWAQFDEPARTRGQALASAGVWQFCRSDAAVAKLATLGIEARRFPLFSACVWNGAPPQPLPQQFTALCYLPPDRRAFHGAELIDSLTRWLPRVRFFILGGDRASYPGQSNVEPLGRVDDVIRTIQRSTVLLQARLDTAPSRLMIEALSLGRHVISNCPWTNCAAARTADEYLVAIRRVQRDLAFNLLGREEVCRGHDRAIASSVLKGIFEAAAVPADLLSRLAAVWSPPPAPIVDRLETLPPEEGVCREAASIAQSPIEAAAQLSRDEAAFLALTAHGDAGDAKSAPKSPAGKVVGSVGPVRGSASYSARASA